MPVTKLTCPKCATVLKPAKPLPEGKKVKCPKCGTLFAAVAEAAPEDKKPRPEPAGAKKKPADKPAPAKPVAEEDDYEGAATYSFVEEDKPPREDDDDDDDDEERERKPKINYAPDMSIKDLRGPAQMAIMRPSNALIFVGIMGFLGWLGLIVVLLIPVLFPLPDDDEGKPRPAKAVGPGLAAASQAPAPAAAFGGGGQAGDKDKKKDEEGKSAFDVAGVDFSLFAVFAWWLLILALLPLILGMVYCAVLTYGAVKMQNLESRGWGIASAILALLPFTTGGMMFLTAFLANWLLNMFFDDPAFSMYVAIVLMSIQTLVALAAGVWNLIVLMKPEVIEGFEYIPEYGAEGEPA
ncbi:MAG TPA: hypothetical protein VFE78_29210 [Gemmataceae bacterium]|nr:hypothetical protein [Gemmataceae bacterium]